jgi:hypothetical protein
VRTKSKTGARPARTIKAPIVVNGIQYMTLKEWAAWKHVSYKTAWRAKSRGEIPLERIGRTERIPVKLDIAAAEATA